MKRLLTRLERLEANWQTDKVLVCYWELDDLYSVGRETFTRDEFRARYGGEPEDYYLVKVYVGLSFDWL